MKRLMKIASALFLFPPILQAHVNLTDLSRDQRKEYTRLIRISPILQGVKGGIQKQFGYLCAPMDLKSFDGDDPSQGTFVAQMVCQDRRPRMGNTGQIVTVWGYFLPEEPVGVQKITIESAG